MPKLWNATIDAHRRAVRDATLDAAAALVGAHGLRAVTMSQIAARTGIGRATLYKYFPDVDSILLAWHERRLTAHLEELTAVRNRVDDPGERLAAVLRTYAEVSRAPHHGHDPELAAALHRHEHVARAHRQLRGLVQDLLIEAGRTGEIRDDIAADELTSYCLHALGAAQDLASPAAVDRLVTVTLAGLRPPGRPDRAGVPGS